MATLAKVMGIELAKGKSIATGTYTGDGGDDRQITTGFIPSLVIIFGVKVNFCWSWLVCPDHTLYYPEDGTKAVTTTDALLHASDGFVVDNVNANDNGDIYQYWAISE